MRPARKPGPGPVAPVAGARAASALGAALWGFMAMTAWVLLAWPGRAGPLRAAVGWLVVAALAQRVQAAARRWRRARRSPPPQPGAGFGGL